MGNLQIVMPLSKPSVMDRQNLLSPLPMLSVPMIMILPRKSSPTIT